MKYNPYTENLKLAVFDIETSGLSPEYSHIISASFCDEDGSRLRQYFCESKESEFLLITKIADEFKSCDGIISYNGKNFDLPFVIERAKHWSLNPGKYKIYNIDIYQILREYWIAGKLLPDFKQNTVEKAFGLDADRTDCIDGRECCSLYSKYSVMHDESIRKKILLHNADDVLQLAKISSSLSFIPFHKLSYDKGYLLKLPDFNIILSKVTEAANSFTVSGQAPSGPEDIMFSCESADFQYDSFSGALRLRIFTCENSNYKYIDLSKLPVKTEEYSSFNWFTNNYLVLRASDLCYREINYLLKDLIEKFLHKKI